MAYQPYDRNPSGVLFFGTNSTDQVFESNNSFVYDSGNNRLGINNAVPSGSLHVDNLQIDTNTLSATNTNGNLIISPNGTGALQADSGGNARGAYAVDLQRVRSAVTQVASGTYSTVSGGRNNTASGNCSTVGGGLSNCASGYCSTVSGGYKNCASSFGSTVSGGYKNCASCFSSTVGGGRSNTASAIYSTVSGGCNNCASATNSTVSGGQSNCANGTCSSVGGGCNNIAHGSSSTISGGYDNCAGDASVVGGGGANCASNASAVVGGLGNTTGGSFTSFIGAGFSNEIANGLNTAIVAGQNNVASGDYSAIVGGETNRTASTALHSFIGGGHNNTINGPRSTISGGCCNTVSANYSTISGGYCNRSLGNGSSVGGGRLNLANHNYSTVGGGYNNCAFGSFSVIAGGGYLYGGCNIAYGGYSSILGGRCNAACGDDSTVGGGSNNSALSFSSSVLGGHCNAASGDYSSALGFCNLTCHTNAHIIGSGITSSAANTLYTNNFCANGTITGTSIIKHEGTSSQFLKADGSVDSTAYTTCVGTVTGVSAGSGMSFTTITSSGPVTLGTPSDVTLSSTSSVTVNSHTHAFTPGGDTTEYIRGNGSLATFPTNIASGIGNSGHIAFWTDTNSLSYDNNQLFWDQTNNRLGVGTASPSYELDIAGSGRFSGNLNINGDLVINGTTTTVNSTVVTIEDPILLLGSGTPSVDDNKDRGVAFNYFDGSAKKGFFGYDDSEHKFTFMTDATIAGEIVSGTVGIIKASLNGNADTATDADGLSSAVTVQLSNQLSGSSTFQDGGDTCTISASLTADAITDQTEIDTVDGNNDHILIYDSGVGLKKVTPQNFIEDLNIVTSFSVSGDSGPAQVIDQGDSIFINGLDGITTSVSDTGNVNINVDDTVIRTETDNGQTISQDLIFDCGTTGAGINGYYVSGLIPTLGFIPGILGTWIDLDSPGPGGAGEFYIAYDNSNSLGNGNIDSIIIHAGTHTTGHIYLEPGNNGRVIIGDNAPALASSGVELHTLVSTSTACNYFYGTVSGGGSLVYKRSAANVKSDIGLGSVENIAVSTLGGSGLVYSGNQLHVGAGNGITVNANDVALASTTAGSGLTYIGGVLDIGEGSLIDVAADSISVDLTEAAAANIANGDYLIFLDGGTNGTASKGSTADLATLMAGEGLVTDGSELDVNVDDSTIEVASDVVQVKDGGITEVKITRTVDASLSNNDTITKDINLVAGGPGGISIKLPVPSSGKIVYVKKIDSAIGAVTVLPNNAETIDGASQKILYSQYESLSFVADSTNWFII